MNDYQLVEDFKELYKQINEWKKQRGLTTQMQREGLIKNLKEEIMELIEAENLNEEIDALCDISVFCIGALDLSLIKEKYFNGYSEFENGYNDIVLQYKKLRKKIKNTNIFFLIFTCINTIEGLGFDYFKCMQETIKEISSRTGKYDDEAKKWIKDTSDEAKAKWYKADYSKCKRK